MCIGQRIHVVQFNIVGTYEEFLKRNVPAMDAYLELKRRNVLFHAFSWQAEAKLGGTKEIQNLLEFPAQQISYYAEVLSVPFRIIS